MFLKHTCKEGERWDQIAWHYYGDVGQMVMLIAANPQAPISETLPGGLQLAIPLLEAKDDALIDQLPPWRRP
ncbi:MULTISPECIES: tail protein X [Chromobacterium]|uniref:Phage tail protein n=2 Tax=Chromobacterium TaxID=535 RepID=A0A5C1DKE2_9NEIS|nr:MULTISPECIES: tail protein X [Chromobacterium]POZ60180.1 hypothetical protein C2I19_20365 [Chromobacterium alticapitis]QEL57063.1 hypothetical protein FYK34_16590 [Chromobacterium paludis]